MAFPPRTRKEPLRRWATRLLLAVRWAAAALSSRFYHEDRDAETQTRSIESHLLVVVRTYTSLDRVIELLHVLKAESGIAVKFTVERGSKFSRALADRLTAEGAHVLTWKEARRQRWDAIFAAHVDKRLARLRGPLFVIPHGVGYNRRRFASTRDDSSVGLSRYEHTHRGHVFAARIGLSHPEQHSRLFGEARDRAVVVGDLVMDKLIASRPLRQEIRESLGIGSRRLVAVTSTWGPCSTLRAQTDLVRRLLAQLPSDEYAVALILHPNVWFGESTLEIVRCQFADELDSGLLIIDHTRWQAPLVAAHIVIGDHGSVTGYAVGLGHPVLVAANGQKELDPGSPVHTLHTALPRLRPDTDLRTQIEQAINDHDPQRWAPYTANIFGLPGEGLKATLAVLFELMNLPMPSRSPRLKRVGKPEAHRGEAITSYRVVVRMEPNSTRGRVERYPALVTTSDDVPGSVIIAGHHEVDQTVKDNAEIFVHTTPMPACEAELWIEACFADCPGMAVAAAAVNGGGCLVVFSDGTRYASSRGDPLVAAAVLYERKSNGNSWSPAEFTISMGSETHTVVVA